MKVVTFILVLFSSFIGKTQIKNNSGFVGVGYGQNITNSFTTNNYQLSGGIRFVNGISSSISISAMRDRTKPPPEFKPLFADPHLLLSISAITGYRFLKSKKVGPAIDLALGTSIYSSATDQFVNSQYTILNSFEEGVNQFKRNLFSGLFFVSVSVDVGKFEFRAGPTFNSLLFNKRKVYSTGPGSSSDYLLGYDYNLWEFGFGFNINCNYHIDFRNSK